MNTADQDAIAKAAAEKNMRNFTLISLEEPIQRGETEIASFTLRKPKGGELRGLSLQDLLTSDVTTILRVIPRISEPILTDHEAAQLGAEDLAQCGGAIRGFFLTAAERKMMDAMIAGQTSMS